MIRDQIELPDSQLERSIKDPQLVQLLRLMQEQLTSQVEVIRIDDLADQTVFPAIPADGYGVFYTPWGMYSASTGGVWLRLHTGVTYAPGDAIPTAL